MERQMLRITVHDIYDKVKNSIIKSKTKFKDILEKIKEAKWRSVGHVARREYNRWKKASDRMATKDREEKERTRRQERRLRDDITTTYIGTTWARTAQDRWRWQLLEEGYIHPTVDDSHEWVIMSKIIELSLRSDWRHAVLMHIHRDLYIRDLWTFLTLTLNRPLLYIPLSSRMGTEVGTFKTVVENEVFPVFVAFNQTSLSLNILNFSSSSEDFSLHVLLC